MATTEEIGRKCEEVRVFIRETWPHRHLPVSRKALYASIILLKFARDRMCKSLN